MIIELHNHDGRYDSPDNLFCDVMTEMGARNPEECVMLLIMRYRQFQRIKAEALR